MCMSKKKILILIVTISVLFIATVSFLIIKNKTDKMEKFEINNNENNEEKSISLSSFINIPFEKSKSMLWA